jgi:hypothetical protein
MVINKAWHLDNLMPKNASFDKRVAWHLEHVKNCSCRKIPKKLAKEMDEAGISYPKDNVDI